MRNSMFKAWSIGIVILVVAYVAWFASLQIDKYAELLILFLWLSPFIAAFVSSYLGPSKKILLGASMAVPASILTVVFNSIYQLMGNSVDYPGIKGGLILFTTTLIYAGIISGVGGAAAYFLSRKK